MNDKEALSLERKNTAFLLIPVPARESVPASQGQSLLACDGYRLTQLALFNSPGEMMGMGEENRKTTEAK